MASRPPGSGPDPGGPPAPHPSTPFHPLAATLLLVFDNLWMLPEFAVVDWFLTVPLCFLCVWTSTLFIQRRMQRDRWMVAFGKAVLLALIAAVPFSVTGTPVGLALLAWFGIKKWRESPPLRPPARAAVLPGPYADRPNRRSNSRQPISMRVGRPCGQV
jgi:hypothetical protein